MSLKNNECMQDFCSGDQQSIKKISGWYIIIIKVLINTWFMFCYIIKRCSFQLRKTSKYWMSGLGFLLSYSKIYFSYLETSPLPLLCGAFVRHHHPLSGRRGNLSFQICYFASPCGVFLYHPKDLLKLFASNEKKGTYFKPDSNGSNIEIWNICQWINISYTVSKVQHATNDWNISSNFIWFNVGLAFRTNYRPKCRLISEICYNIYSFHLSYSKFFLAWQSSDYLD